MNLTCPECSTKFKVPEKAIGEGGRFVRCSSCQHEWLAKVEQVKQKRRGPKRYVAPKVVVPLHDRALVYWGSIGLGITAFLVFVVTILALYHGPIGRKIPLAQKLYDIAGIYEDYGLKLQTVDCTISKIKSSKNDNRTFEVEVDVIVKNTSDQDQKLDNIRFSVYDKDKSFEGDLVMHLDRVIAPGDTAEVEGRLNRIPKDSVFVTVDIGNSLDLHARSLKQLHRIHDRLEAEASKKEETKQS